MINWGYFQSNLLIYSTDVLLHMIFKVKSSRPKFPADLAYEEETVEFQHPSSLKSKQYTGRWDVPKLFWNQTISWVLFIHIGITLPPADFSQFGLRQCLANPTAQTTALTGNPRCTEVYQFDTFPSNKVFFVSVYHCSLNPNRKIILHLHLSL